VSVFLDIPETRWVASNDLAFAIRDAYPVSPGHTLIITRRVVADWFSATSAERLAVLELVDLVKRQLDEELHPDGFNVGFNAGAAAGQTVQHLHMHVIPRFHGDMDDPRGGIRHVIPSRGNYLRSVKPLATGGAEDPFAHHVLPLFEQADEIDIVAAFVQESGLEKIQPAILTALRRGARIRIIAGDYLDITQASALELLLDWEQATAADDEQLPGKLEAAVVEVEQLPPPVRSFHPKAWRFESQSFGIAFVGSSNLSRSALDTGVEWNLRVDRDRDSVAYRRVHDAFEALWTSARRLDARWIADYARRARRVPSPLPVGEVEAEPLALPPTPHEVQLEALACLRDARASGHRRALFVLATGLGKTWLAAFDYAQLREELGRRPRLLFLAHRGELLRQAARTYRCLLRAAGETARAGWFVGDEGELDAELVFASVAKLSRRKHLPRLQSQHFDYVVVDEVHHAAADSYRRILDNIDAYFLLGLTATPDRADSADILGLFNELVAFSAGIPRGVELGRLVPFHYFGVKDEIDYENIPWRNRQFDAEALAAAAQTEARMQTFWRAWQQHPGKRSLIFCCSIAHAVYVRTWLRSRSLKVDAVFSGPDSDARETALASLERGELDAVCAVDIFNEGVDVPTIDRVVMLRPTESNVVFLQQLGRGLRAADGKTAVVVIDFVGNHRIFVERVRTLLSLGGTNASADSVRTFLESEGPEDLPAGCSVT
jgi:superfamily II DNA or RNA helicase/diadenosine tetraphosphate (Ap4A) HIT family hydrolase